MLLGAGAVLAGVVGSTALTQRWAPPRAAVAAVRWVPPAPAAALRERAAAAPAPVGLPAVLALASTVVGRRLRGSPWEETVDQDLLETHGWSAAWVAWLLRTDAAVGAARTPEELLRALGGTTASGPTPGAVAFYADGSGSGPTRVGLVSSVTAGVAQTLEGDHPLLVPPGERFVRRLPRPGPGRVSYVVPA